MSDLQAARQSLQVELEHAKQGVEFYRERIAALEEAFVKILELDRLSPVSDRKPRQPAAKRGRKARMDNNAASAPGKKARRKPGRKKTEELRMEETA